MAASTSFLKFAQFLLVVSFSTFAVVLGCGTLPQGQVTAMRFNLNGFTLAAEMAYSQDATVQTRVPSLSRDQNAARTFVRDLIMNAVNDVLQEQGRNALLPDPVISLILQQLNVSIEYTPLECKMATTDATNMAAPRLDVDGCFVIDGMVTSLCAMLNDCNFMTGAMLKPLPPEHRVVSGSLRTSNVIMATWSKQMWQSILNRVYRRLSSGQFRRFFSTAIVVVNS